MTVDTDCRRQMYRQRNPTAFTDQQREKKRQVNNREKRCYINADRGREKIRRCWPMCKFCAYPSRGVELCQNPATRGHLKGEPVRTCASKSCCLTAGQIEGMERTPSNWTCRGRTEMCEIAKKDRKVLKISRKRIANRWLRCQ